MGPVIYGVRPPDPNVNTTVSRDRPSHVVDRAEDENGKRLYTREKSQNKFRTIEAIFQQFRMKMNEINSPGPEGIVLAADMDAKAAVEAAN